MFSYLAMMPRSYGPQPEDFGEGLYPLLAFAVTVLVYVVLTLDIPYLLYRLITIPLRRQERARLFLDIVESCARQGKSIENAIVSLAEMEPRPDLISEMFPTFGPVVWGFVRGLVWFILPGREDVFGHRLRRLAGLLTRGLPLADSLQQVPGIVPAHVAEMLRIGGETGNILKVLPACRKSLTTATSKVRGAMNYVVVFSSGFFFSFIVVILGIVYVIAPRMRDMVQDMAWDNRRTGLPSFALPEWITDPRYTWWLVYAAGILAVVLLLFAIYYVGGSRLNEYLALGPVADRLVLLLPWRRMELQRDFSAMLAVLLDGGVPEGRAVEMAARATANRVLIRRGAAAVDALRQGRPLTEAIARLDRTGELKWRLANALHRNAGFLDALAGWHESLEAKAFQAEQAAAQVITTLLVLANGAIVGLFAVGLFQLLLVIIKAASVW